MKRREAIAYLHAKEKDSLERELGVQTVASNSDVTTAQVKEDFCKTSLPLRKEGVEAMDHLV